MKRFVLAGLLLLTSILSADVLGFVQQKFSYLNFEKGQWDRVPGQPPCYTYTARENGATVDVLRYSSSNLVPFKATKGLKVTVCGDSAAFDEGFEAVAPIIGAAAQKPRP